MTSPHPEALREPTRVPPIRIEATLITQNIPRDLGALCKALLSHDAGNYKGFTHRGVQPFGRRKVVLGHTLNTLQHIITKKKSHNVLSKLTILFWGAFTAILGRWAEGWTPLAGALYQAPGKRLDIYSLLGHESCLVTLSQAKRFCL